MSVVALLVKSSTKTTIEDATVKRMYKATARTAETFDEGHGRDERQPLCRHTVNKLPGAQVSRLDGSTLVLRLPLLVLYTANQNTQSESGFTNLGPNGTRHEASLVQLPQGETVGVSSWIEHNLPSNFSSYGEVDIARLCKLQLCVERASQD